MWGGVWLMRQMQGGHHFLSCGCLLCMWRYIIAQQMYRCHIKASCKFYGHCLYFLAVVRAKLSCVPPHTAMGWSGNNTSLNLRRDSDIWPYNWQGRLWTTSAVVININSLPLCSIRSCNIKFLPLTHIVLEKNWWNWHPLSVAWNLCSLCMKSQSLRLIVVKSIYVGPRELVHSTYTVCCWLYVVVHTYVYSILQWAYCSLNLLSSHTHIWFDLIHLWMVWKVLKYVDANTVK